MFKRFALVSAAVLTGLTVAAAPASATEGASSTRADTRVVGVRFSEPSSTVRRGTPSAAGCRRITGSLTGYNRLRQPQWSFSMRASWCWASGRITYRYSRPTVSSPGWFWRFVRWSGNSSSQAGRGPWIRYRQAHFAQCIPLPTGGDVCGHEAHPWLELFMYANGTWRIGHS